MARLASNLMLLEGDKNASMVGILWLNADQLHRTQLHRCHTPSGRDGGEKISPNNHAINQPSHILTPTVLKKMNNDHSISKDVRRILSG